MLLAAVSMLLAAISLLLAAISLQLAAISLLLAAISLLLAAISLQLAAISLQLAAWGKINSNKLIHSFLKFCLPYLGIFFSAPPGISAPPKQPHTG